MCLLSGHFTVIILFHVSVRSWTSASDNHPLTRAPRALPPQRQALLPEQHFMVRHIKKKTNTHTHSTQTYRTMNRDVEWRNTDISLALCCRQDYLCSYCVVELQCLVAWLISQSIRKWISSNYDNQQRTLIIFQTNMPKNVLVPPHQTADKRHVEKRQRVSSITDMNIKTMKLI